jgi:transposase
MTKMTNSSIGIDISKDRLDVHRLSDGAYRQFDNDISGFLALRSWIGKDLPARVKYEPNGPYHGHFERTLSGCLPLVKINPLQARRFAQACGTRTKTDAVDARMLAQMGQALGLAPDRPISENQRGLNVADRTDSTHQGSDPASQPIENASSSIYTPTDEAQARPGYPSASRA